MIFSPKMNKPRKRREVGCQLDEASMTAGHETASFFGPFRPPEFGKRAWRAKTRPKAQDEEGVAK
jgi:hypothetical protein